MPLGGFHNIPYYYELFFPVGTVSLGHEESQWGIITGFMLCLDNGTVNAWYFCVTCLLILRF